MIFNTNDNSSTMITVCKQGVEISDLTTYAHVELDTIPKEINIDGVLCPRILNVMANVVLSSKGSKGWVPITDYYFSHQYATPYFYVKYPEGYTQYNYNESKQAYVFDVQVIYEIGA